jgi:hypothetical protein
MVSEAVTPPPDAFESANNGEAAKPTRNAATKNFAFIRMLQQEVKQRYIEQAHLTFAVTCLGQTGI